MSQVDRFSLKYLTAQQCLSHFYHKIKHRLKVDKISKLVKVGHDKLSSIGLNHSQVKQLIAEGNRILGNKSEVPNGIFCINPEDLKYGAIIGLGRFGIVFEGTLNSTKVAVKLPRAKVMGGSMFHSLDHPNLVKYIGVTPDPLLIVSRYVEGVSLRRFLDSQAKLPVRTILDYCRKLLDGMVFLHVNGIVHGSLSSHQVIVGGFDLKISDYNLSHTHNRDAWLAPELLEDAEVTFSSDVWAFTVIVWEMFAIKTLPWAGLGLSELRVAHREGTLPKNDSCPVPMETMLRMIWLLPPESRPSFVSLRLEFAEMNFETVRLLSDYGIFKANDYVFVIDSRDALLWRGQSLSTLDVGTFIPACCKSVTLPENYAPGNGGIVPGSFHHLAHIGRDGSCWGFPESPRKVLHFGAKSHHYQPSDNTHGDDL